jgi:hypothetical protein
MNNSPSPEKIAANRANAQKSTGPRTAAGRNASKMNALKHGILSRETVVRGRCLQEDEREFTALHQRLWDDLMPAGPLEEMLVDRIVTAHWRLRRALKAEAGEIALNVDDGNWQRNHHDAAQASQQWAVLSDPVPAMRDSVLGNLIMENQLQAVRNSVQLTGELTSAAIKQVILNGRPYTLTQELLDLHTRLQSNPNGSNSNDLRTYRQEQALAFLDEKLRSISWSKTQCAERDKKQEEAHQAAAVLPSSVVLEKILRYETKLERQLYQAINQLERLQRMRQGEAIPPPVNVQLTQDA